MVSQLQQANRLLKAQLQRANKQIKTFQQTPDGRFIKAKRFVAEGNYLPAISELTFIQQHHPKHRLTKSVKRLLQSTKKLQKRKTTLASIKLISAKGLVAIYKRNEVAADLRFKRKQLKVYGRIKDITKTTFLKKLYINIDTGEIITWQFKCYVSRKSLHQVVNLRKGQEITVFGKFEGKSVYHLEMKNCQIVE